MDGATVPVLSILLASRCPACSAATTLPLSLFFLLVDIAAGGQLVLVALDLRGEVTRGFLKLTTVMYLSAALIAGLVLLAAPLSAYQRLYHWGGSWTGVAYVNFFAFLAATVGYAISLFRGASPHPAARAVAGGGAAAGLLGLAAPLASLGIWPAGSIAITLALLAGALAVGAVSTGMLLGHWYLVTPTLTAAPLQWVIGRLWLVLVLQALAFPVALTAAGAGAAHGLAGVLRGYALLSALWALGAVAMPLVAVSLAWLTCRLRSFMSTTGLLYLAMASVLGGQILGAELFLLVAAG